MLNIVLYVDWEFFTIIISLEKYIDIGNTLQNMSIICDTFLYSIYKHLTFIPILTKLTAVLFCFLVDYVSILVHSPFMWGLLLH